MPLKSCGIPEITETELERLQVDPNKKTELQQRIDNLQAVLKAGQAGVSNPRRLDTQAIAVINNRNIRRVGESIRTMAFKPEQANAFQRFLTRELGVVHQYLGISDEFSSMGWARESINRIRRVWSGGISQQFRTIGAVQYAHKHYGEVVRLLRSKGLRTDQIDRITTDLVEKMFYPIIRGSQNLPPRTLAVLDKKYGMFWDDLINKYGLSPAEANHLLEVGEKMAGIQHRIAVMAEDAGIAGSDDLWNAYPRILSDAAERRVNWRHVDRNTVGWNTGESEPVTELLLKSRTADKFVVEDEALLDLVLRQLGSEDTGNPRHYFELAGLEPDSGVADLLDSDHALPLVISAALKNRHSEVVGRLIDTGLLGKLPLSTAETFEALRDTLKFPFDNLREVFAVDWETGMRVQREQLEMLAKKSGFVNLMVSEAISGNWGVSAATRNANPSQYGSWVPLREAIDPRILNTSFQSFNPMVGNLYVHPMIADLSRSMQAVQMSPQAMGVFGRILNSMGTTFKSMALASVEYLPRQVWQTLISLGAAGGNIAMLPVNIVRFGLYQLLGDNHPELAAKLFNNTRKRYRLSNGQLLTELELVRYLQDSGYLSRFEPLTGDAVNPQGYHSFNIQAQLKYLAHTFRTESPLRGLQETIEIGSQYLNKLTYPIAWSNNWMNNAGAFTAVESLTRIRNGSIPEHILHTGGRLPTMRFGTYGTVEEAVQHASKYFFFYDDTTAINRDIGRFVIPFWGFSSRNIPSVVRYAVRHPSRFYAWQRAYALANRPVQDDEWLNEGSVDEWMLHANPIWFKTPDGYFAIPMESIDPLNSAVNWIKEPLEAVSNHFGLWSQHSVQTTRSRLEQQPWSESHTNSALTSLLEKSYPHWRLLAAEVTGRHSLGFPLQEGETVDEFLGIRVSPRTRLWLETLMPVLSTLNRYNPGNVFGTPPQYNVQDGQWTLGEPSFAGVPRSSRDRFQTDNPYRNLQFIGVKVYPVDVYMNAGLTFDQLQFSVREGNRMIEGMRSDLARLPEGLRAQRETEIAQVEYIVNQTREDLRKFEAFMRREGLNPYQAYDKLRSSNIRVGDLR